MTKIVESSQMLLILLLLTAMVLAAEEEKVIDDYVVKIKDDTLINVQPTEKSSEALDLSGLGLRGLENDALDNLTTLKILSLANNSLSSIPREIFSKLTNLEHLSLANNNISEFPIAFASLHRLKSLNISHNPVTRLRYSALYGLPKTSVVLTEGIKFDTINMNVFEKAAENFDVLDEYRAEELNAKLSHCFKFNAAKMRNASDDDRNNIKVCIEDGVLRSVEPLVQGEVLPSNCRRVRFVGILKLDNMGISRFDKDWYRLDPKHPVIMLNLTNNEIAEVTSEMLNDLPATIYDVDLSNNKIQRLKRDVIRNPHITMIHLNSNDISEIEDDAFEHLPSLTELYMSGNQLKDTRFVRTLPKTMYKIYLQKNKIAEISSGSFTDHDELMYLYLGHNLLEELKTDSLLGLSNLFLLELSNNRVTKLQSGCFQHTRNIHTILLDNNIITGFENGTFDDLEKLTELNVTGNKLTSIKDNFPNGLPENLFTLKSGFNSIEKLERDTFSNAPRYRLHLEGNKISKIEEGAFHLPNLTTLILDNNNLTEFDSGSFQGLNSLKRLSLMDNGITKIPKGFAKNLNNLADLDLGHNPIKSLENGALFGLKKSKPSYPNLIYLTYVMIEIIEAGLFDDM